MSDRRPPTPIHGIPLSHGSPTPVPQARLRSETTLPPLPADPVAAIAVLGDRMQSVERRLGEGAQTFGAITASLERYGERWSQSLGAVEAAAGASLKEVERRLGDTIAEKIGDLRGDVSSLAASGDRRALALEASVERLKPRAQSAGKMILAWLPLAVAVGSLIWAAARYPERGEFRDLERTVEKLAADARVLEIQLRTTPRSSP